MDGATTTSEPQHTGNRQPGARTHGVSVAAPRARKSNPALFDTTDATNLVEVQTANVGIGLTICRWHLKRPLILFLQKVAVCARPRLQYIATGTVGLALSQWLRDPMSCLSTRHSSCRA